MRVEMDLRNFPRFRIMEYLVEAGGQLTAEYAVSGTSWTAELIAMDPINVGLIKVRRDMLVIDGDDSAVPDIEAFMRRKTMRGGG